MQVLTRSPFRPPFDDPGLRRHPGSEETRLRILVAAREVFECKGTRGTTTREVADLAGVNEATLFRHFGSKAALLAAMREHSCGLDEFREIVSALAGGDDRGNLVMLGRRTVETMHRQRSLLCISLAEDARTSGALDAPEWRGPAQMLELLAAYFAGRVAAGRLAGDPGFLAQTFMGLMFQYVLARRLWRSDEIDPQAVDALVDVFLNGVAR